MYDAFQEDLAVLNIYFSESTAIGEFENENLFCIKVFLHKLVYKTDKNKENSLIA